MKTVLNKIRWWLAAPVLALAASTALHAQAQQPAQAQTAWPAKPIRIIVTYPPGGTSDIIARLSAQILQEALGKPVTVENKAGVSGNLGTDYVAKSPPDGYTLLQGTFGPITTNQALYANLPYVPERDLVGVALVAQVPNILLVRPGLPVKTVAELVSRAKATKGETTIAISGIGGTPHLLAEVFKNKAGIDMTNIPYKGAAPAIVDLIGGQVDVDIEALPVVFQHVHSGKMRALAVMGPERVRELPDLPTMREIGYPDAEITPWHGLMAPAGTPREVVATINRAINEALKTPAVQNKLTELGASKLSATPQEMDAFLAAERTRWQALIRTYGISAE